MKDKYIKLEGKNNGRKLLDQEKNRNYKFLSKELSFK